MVKSPKSRVIRLVVSTQWEERSTTFFSLTSPLNKTKSGEISPKTYRNPWKSDTWKTMGSLPFWIGPLLWGAFLGNDSMRRFSGPDLFPKAAVLKLSILGFVWVTLKGQSSKHQGTSAVCWCLFLKFFSAKSPEIFDQFINLTFRPSSLFINILLLPPKNHVNRFFWHNAPTSTGMFQLITSLQFAPSNTGNPRTLPAKPHCAMETTELPIQVNVISSGPLRPLEGDGKPLGAPNVKAWIFGCLGKMNKKRRSSYPPQKTRVFSSTCAFLLAEFKANFFLEESR